ncbi:MAG TPA: hypothetical protein VF693_03070 [Allosphingosinicella sp.]
MKPPGIVALAAALLFTTPAAAQRGEGTPSAGSPAEIHALATCIADDYYGVEVLEILPQTEREFSQVRFRSTWDGRGCRPANRMVIVGPPYMRGAAAEYLLESRSRRTQRVFSMPGNEEMQRLGTDTRAAILLIQVGECAARANLPGVMALLGTAVESPEERAAVRALVPAIAGCVPQGVSFQLPPLLARAYLAEGAYRNSVADRARARR